MRLEHQRIRVSELNGRHPLYVHRERSQHCQFLQSERIRKWTIYNTPRQRFEPFTVNDTEVNDTNVDQVSHYDSPVYQTNNKIEGILVEDDDVSHRRQQMAGQTTIGSPIGEVAEKIQNCLSINRIEQSHVSQPSEEIADGMGIEIDSDASMLLSGKNKIQPILSDSYSQRRDTPVSHQESSNNGDHIHVQGPIEGATAAPSPSSLTQAPSTPPPRNPRYEQETVRRESFIAWNGRHDIDSLIEAGLFYTGDQDIVRCFHCDIGLAEWNREDDPWQEHARHSHACHFLLQTKGQAYVDEVQREWSKVYSPKRPELSHVDKRLDTFHNNWPSDFVVQTPRQLAIAGFYYAGMTDTVRCHYCDGGLREWEPGDVPWVEHAKWLPHCKFVLKIKGLPFIQQCAARRNVYSPKRPELSHFDKRMDTFHNWPSRFVVQTPQQLATAGFYYAWDQDIVRCFHCDIGLAEWNRDDVPWQEHARHSHECHFLLQTKGQAYVNEVQREWSKEFLQDPVDNNAQTQNGALYGLTDAPALLKMNETRRMERLCIDCRTRERRLLFRPCGHLLLCDICAQKCSRCLRCDTKIKEKVKIYLS